MRHHRIPVAIAACTLITALVSPAVAGAASPPDEWPSSVAPIARSVERVWGARFDHPVRVRFLSDRAFRKEVTADDADLTKAERRDIAQTRDELAAFGLVAPDLDLLSQTNDVSGEGVLAYYDIDKEEIVVRGKRLDVETRVTLAHELTHALQDQRFDLDRLTERAERGSSGAAFALDALTEGDAINIEDRYISKLSDADYEEYDRAQSEGYDTFEQDTADVPEIIQVIFDAPYSLGPGLTGVARARGGRRALQALFRRPPTTEAAVLRAGIGTRPAVKVALPKLTPGERRIGADGPTDFGALTMYSVLASRLEPHTALAAADAWAGDATLTFRREGRTCVRTAFAGRTGRDLATITDAWQQWAATLPVGTATVDPSDARVTVTSCTPPAPVAPSRSVFDAIDLVALRHQFLVELLQSDVPAAAAACIADGIARDPQITDVVDAVDAAPDDEAANERLGAIVEREARACGAP